MRKEQKNRRRSLLAWVTAIALLLGWLRVPYIKAQAGDMVEGVSLTVEYVAGDSVVTTETYSRYYEDGTNTTMEKYVTITAPDDSVLSGDGGSLLVAWEYTGDTAVTRVLPGKTMVLSWDELLADGAMEATVTMSAWLQNYTVELEYLGEDYNYYWIDNLSEKEPIEIISEENYVSISAPSKVPVMGSHHFLRWQLYSGSELLGETDTAGGMFTSTSSYGSNIPYDKLGDSWTLKAVWTPKATISFYEDSDKVDDNIVCSTVEIIKQDGVPFEFKTPLAPENSEKRVFLAWLSDIDYKYLAANETVTYADWPSLSSGYVGSVVGTWLNVSYEFGDEMVEDWQATPSVEKVSDSGFTISAPEVVPKAKDAKKYFGEWNVAVNDMKLLAGAGEKLYTEDGLNEFSYESFSDATLNFTANWVDLLYATVTYDLDGGELNGSTEPMVYEQVQSTPEEESFTVTTPSAPTRAGYTFVAWQYTNEDGMVYQVKAEQSTADVLPDFYYIDKPEVNFTAVWQQTATVHYVPNPTMIPAYTENIDKDEEEDSLSITLPQGSIVENEAGGEFLVWSGEGFTPYYALPDSVATIPWKTIAESEGVVNVMAHWLYHEILFGDVEVKEYNGSSYAIAEENGFYIYAPEEPEAVVNEEKYFFLNWSAEFSTGMVFDEVSPGEPIAALKEDGESMAAVVFDYENYADSTVSFTAQWQKAEKATFSFDPAGGIIKGETTPLTTVSFQEEISDTVFTALMPAAPSYDRHIFKGWKYTAEDGTEYVFDGNEDTESQNLFFTYGKDTQITFTALWSEIPAEATLLLYYDESRTEQMSVKREILLDDNGMPYTDAMLDAGPEIEDKTQLFVGWYHDEKGYVASGATVTFMWNEEIYETEFVGQWATIQYDFGNVDVKQEPELPLVSTSSAETVNMVSMIMPDMVPEAVETESTAYAFVDWRIELLGEAYEEGAGAEIGNFLVEDLQGTIITVKARWTATSKETIVTEGTVELKEGQRYVFPEGSWRIEGDSSIYTGGMAFYVPSSGTYSILKGEE